MPVSGPHKDRTFISLSLVLLCNKNTEQNARKCHYRQSNPAAAWRKNYLDLKSNSSIQFVLVVSGCLNDSFENNQWHQSDELNNKLKLTHTGFLTCLTLLNIKINQTYPSFKWLVCVWAGTWDRWGLFQLTGTSPLEFEPEDVEEVLLVTAITWAFPFRPAAVRWSPYLWPIIGVCWTTKQQEHREF